MQQYNTVPEMLTEVCKKHPNNIAYKYKNGENFTDIKFEEVYNLVEKLSLSFLELGIKKGDRVGLVSENRFEWVISSFAINSIGAVDVPIFPILTSEQESYIFNDCEATAVIVSNKFQLSKIMKVKDKIKSLRQIIIFEDVDEKDINVKTFDELIKNGEQLLKNNSNTFLDKAAAVETNDLLTLIYTSGTTGDPKGVMLSHKNILSNVAGATDLNIIRADDTALSYLPFCHAFERTTGFYTLFSYGACCAIAESIDAVPRNIKEVSPTVMTTVPKLMETIKKKIFSQMEREGGMKLKIFNWAVGVGSKKVKNQSNRKSSFLNDKAYGMADKLVFSKIREKMGGRLDRFISGGAALPYEVAEFFTMIGLEVFQGYGLTETSPCISCNNSDNNELGTIGQVMLNQDVKIGSDGEILVKGPNVMMGYWNNEKATKEAINEEGWLHTGDIGEFTEKGNLRITDRKKNIFVNKGGKNIAPQPVESALNLSIYVNQIVLIGDNKEYNIALIHCNDEPLIELANKLDIDSKNLKELRNNPIIIKEIKRNLDLFQKHFAKYEQARKISLLENPLTIENGELTPKQSIKRHIVIDNYKETIEQLYS